MLPVGREGRDRSSTNTNTPRHVDVGMCLSGHGNVCLMFVCAFRYADPEDVRHTHCHCSLPLSAFNSILLAEVTCADRCLSHIPLSKKRAHLSMCLVFHPLAYPS